MKKKEKQLCSECDSEGDLYLCDLCNNVFCYDCAEDHLSSSHSEQIVEDHFDEYLLKLEN